MVTRMVIRWIMILCHYGFSHQHIISRSELLWIKASFNDIFLHQAVPAGINAVQIELNEVVLKHPCKCRIRLSCLCQRLQCRTYRFIQNIVFIFKIDIVHTFNSINLP
ncbi:hypothetical protein D3C73_796440 [compost metagenome]